MKVLKISKCSHVIFMAQKKAKDHELVSLAGN